MHMGTRNRATALIITGLALVALTGCMSSDRGPTDSSGITQTTVTLEDGREIVCLVWEGYHKGGLSCDWSSR